MAAYRWVYDSRHLQTDCQEPGSVPEPYARQSLGYLYLYWAPAKPRHAREAGILKPVRGLKKFSHTRYRALGPELIQVYRQSARR